MYRKLTFLISAVLVAALAGMASAAGVTCPDSILNGETVTVGAGETWTADCSSCGGGLCRMYIGDGVTTGHLVVNGGTANIYGGTNFDDGRVCIEFNSDITVNDGEVYISSPGGGLQYPDEPGAGTPPAIYVHGGIVTIDEDRISANCQRDGSMYVGCGTLRMRTAPGDWCGGSRVVAMSGNEPLNYLGVDDEGYHVFTGSNCMPSVGFAAAASGQLESVSPAVLDVVLSEAQTSTVTVDYAATGGTATSGVDHNLAPGTLTFNAGETQKTIDIDIINDGLDEEDETIIVELSDPAAAGGDVGLGTSEHVYNILDSRPAVEFGTTSSGGHEGIATANIPLHLTRAAGEQVTVDYSVKGGSASRNVDYTVSEGTLTFNPGQTSTTVVVNIIEDDLEEGDETIVLTLLNPVNAKLGGNVEHTFTINDNELLIIRDEFVGNSFSTENHSSSIAETHNGTLVVTWYAGSEEAEDDVSIWVSRNEGSGWSSRMEVDDGDNRPTWNPVLFQPSTGPLLLYYKFSGMPFSWIGAARKSYDDGKTWSNRILLPESDEPYFSRYGGRFEGPTKNRPIELPDGSLLMGSSSEHDNMTDFQVHMEIARGDYTSDFELIGPIGGGEAIQPSFLVHDDGYQTIQALCRAPGDGSRTPTTWSYDGGHSWSSLSTISLETSKGLHAVTVNNLNQRRNRWHILAYNPSGRYPLRIAKSTDGVNWEVAIDNITQGSGGDMDYPTIMQSSDKMLHLVHTFSSRSKIRHVVINPYVLLNEPACVTCGDFDGDGIVDSTDLGQFSRNWLSAEELNMADLNCDGVVDCKDFARLANQWQDPCD